jgi:hypothetical protein
MSYRNKRRDRKGDGNMKNISNDRWEEEINNKAKAAQDKPAKLGVDVDIDKFRKEEESNKVIADRGNIISVDKLSEDIKQAASSVGMITSENDKRAGTFFQHDNTVVLACGRSDIKGIEILSTPEALNKYDWVKDYYWRAVPVDMDKYTAYAQLDKYTAGYFIRSKPGTRLTVPVQACLFIGTQGLLQAVHNIIIAEEDSELHIITGCTIHPEVSQGMHIGISEFYIKKGATITFTMIHGWAEDIEVRPRTGAIIEAGGKFISNYICFKPVKSIQMYPTAYLVGDGSKARYHTLLYGSGESLFDIGSRVVLSGKNTSAELTARCIAKDKTRIIARGHMIGEISETKAHLDCRGLLLSNTASIHAIPELEGKAEGCELSHEAAVGKIQQEQLCYLMARGLTQDEATALIVRGFLDPEIPELPETLRIEVKKAIELTRKEEGM